MLRRLNRLLCGGLLFAGGASLLAQTPAPAAPVPATPVQTATAAPAPEGMPGPGLPAGPNASAEACANVPDGGAPYFLKAETREQRQARLGTAEDPGCDPDPSKSFFRFGTEYKIGKYDRLWAFYTGGHDANAIRPFGFVNSYRELYQQNEKWVWAWEKVPEPQKPLEEDLQKRTQSNTRFSDGDVEYLQRARSEFFEVTPRESTKTVRFEEASDGLPASGSWRNSLAVGDINGDGFPDLIAPPERAGATGIPAIFLGDGKGHWKYWQEVRWPRRFDYGGVAAGDFNKDGKTDLAFAVHLSGVFVVLGDGKGTFREVSEGLPRDFPTRRLLITDVDRDGYPDIVAISEGPTAMQNAAKTLGKIRVYYNRDKGGKWEGVDVVSPQTRVGGDYLVTGNFNGDKYPDIVAASIYMGSPDVVYMSKGAKQWSALDSKVGSIIPFLSYYFASGTGKFSSKKADDLILSYVRFWPTDINEKLIPRPSLTEETGIDRISFAADGTPKRTPIARWGSKFGVSGLGVADFNGDGNLDLMYTAPRSAEARDIVLLLGDGKGNFERARLEGLTAERKATYDLKIADVNNDGRSDVIIMYEADQGTAFSPRDGSIHVFLNRGPVAPAKVADR